MFAREELLYWSDCIYKGLLSLYPIRFRRRFGAEMVQIFRDCSHSEAETGKLLALWSGTFKDLCTSLPCEWRREIERPDSEVDYTGLADAFMIFIVVGTNLIGWGSFAAAIMLNFTLPGIIQYWSGAATVLVCGVTLVLAALIGAIFALVVGRIGRSELPHIKV